MQVAKIMNATEKVVTILSNDFKDEMLLARDEFLKIFGNIDEDSENYENQTYLFHYWMLLNFKSERMNIKDWFFDQLVPTMKDSFEGLAWSVFEFQGANFLKKLYIKDILSSKKLLLVNDSKEPCLCKGDFFIGRVVPWEDSYILLPGLLMLPREIITKVKKKSKLLLKTALKELKASEKQMDFNLIENSINTKFLLELSGKASRWSLYKNSDYNKIFEL